MKSIFFTVTNDLSYDQRMIRICRSLAANGYSVTLVGRNQLSSIPLRQEIFKQKRLSCVFHKGKAFYAEYNIRLFFYLLRQRMDGICAIDLDTILPCLWVSGIKRIVRIYDAHELFSEMKEVITNPAVKKVWTAVERFAVPRFSNGYTVSQSIAEEFEKRYKVRYEVIRNVPLLSPASGGISREGLTQSLHHRASRPSGKHLSQWIPEGKPFILYQGAVNEARGLEQLIPAMRGVNCTLLICGEGNLLAECKALTHQYELEHKVIFTGRIEPVDLKEITRHAYIGINLVEARGLNQLYSLANKFFDYIHAAVPQVTMDFPEYKRINDQIQIAALISDTDEKKIAAAINNLLENTVLYSMLQDNCKQAQHMFNWQEEEKTLLHFYHKTVN